MRLRLIAATVMVLAVALVGCSDDTDNETESVTTTEPATATTSTSELESGAGDGEGDAELQALQALLAEQGIDESLAGFGLEWCRHQSLARLSTEVGNMELAEQVSAAASETVC